MDQNSIILIDIAGYVHRAHHAAPHRERSDGLPTTVLPPIITGLFRRLVTKAKTPRIALVFDGEGASRWRRKIHPDYKADRTSDPVLEQQWPLVREAANLHGLPQIEISEREADDVIAHLTQRSRSAGHDVTIAATDKDLCQLVTDASPTVRIYDPTRSSRGTIYTATKVEEDFGVTPKRLADYQALAGDKADGIPGIPSVGAATARKIVNQFSSVDEMIKHAHEIPYKKARQNILNDPDHLRRMRRLTELGSDVYINTSLESLKLQPLKSESLANWLKQQNMDDIFIPNVN